MDAEPKAILEIDRIGREFGGLVALDDVSCRVHEGQILALIGPNGAGKTTLLNIVAGALQPTRGHVLFRGRRLQREAPQERVRLGIARTFQQAHTFANMTVLENVLVGCHLRGRCGLAEAALRLPRAAREEEDLYLDAMRFLNLVGLGSHAHQEAGVLPFGQQRLLAIARAMATGPALLLLDEPAAGLNRLEKNDLAELIQRIRQAGITILLVEHDMELVMRLAEWVVVLDHGRRIAQGTPAQVRRDPAVIAAYLGEEED
ncbi:MAG: ABC transporter ATP-binding protein [Anaerolineae bacterium]